MEKNYSMAENIAAYKDAASNYSREPITQETFYKLPEESANGQRNDEPTPEPTQTEPVAEAAPSSPITEEVPRESSKEYNLRVLRERAETEERRRKEAEQRANQMEEQMRQLQQQWKPHNNPQNQTTAPEENEPEPEDDDIPTWGQQKRYLKKLEKQLEAQRSEWSAQQQQSKMQQAEALFTREHPDASSVLSKENLDMLKRIYPHDFAGVEANPDLYGKLKSAYNMVRRYGIMEDQEVEQRAVKNASKPRPGTVGNSQVSESALGKVDEYGRRELSEADKEQMRMSMAKARGLI
jgi:hypothetical protein